MSNTAHFEIGLRRVGDHEIWNPADLNRGQHNSLLNPTTHYEFDTSNYNSSVHLDTPEVNQTLAVPFTFGNHSDFIESEIAKHIQHCQGAQCELDRDLEIESGSLFQAFASQDAEHLPEQFSTLKISD